MSSSPEARAYEWLRQGNTLAAVQAFQEEGWPNESMRLQSFAWVLSAVGRYREAQQAFNEGTGPRETLPLSSQEELDAMDRVPLEAAEQMVLRAAEERQIVILNEAHHQPEHRVFGARLIPKLAALGVKYLALETSRQAGLDEAMKTGRVTVETDSYSFEPRRAELLRTVLRAGMKLVAFDFMTPEEQEERRRDPSRNVSIREAAMARNIEEGVLRHDPAAKILIWVGGDHACKRPWFGNEWMALRLWRRTGIEPFSICQVSDSGDLAYDEPIYGLLVRLARRRFEEAQAVRLPVASFGDAFPDELRQHPIYSRMIGHGMDAAVLHPPEPFETATERPAWLRPEDAAEIHETMLRDQAPCDGHLLQALHEEEGDLSAPADQVITDRLGRYQLRVRPGRYRLRVWAPAERAGDEQVATILPAIALNARQTVRREIHLPHAD